MKDWKLSSDLIYASAISALLLLPYNEDSPYIIACGIASNDLGITIGVNEHTVSNLVLGTWIYIAWLTGKLLISK